MTEGGRHTGPLLTLRCAQERPAGWGGGQGLSRGERRRGRATGQVVAAGGGGGGEGRGGRGGRGGGRGGEGGGGGGGGWTADHSTAKSKGPAAPGEGGASGKWGHLGLSGHPHLDQPECSEVWVDLLERGEMKRYF